MKFFKDQTNKVYAFSADGSQDEFISDQLISITQSEADAIRFPPQTVDQMIEKYTAIIQTRLDDFAATRGYDNVNSASKYKDIADDDISTLPAELQTDVKKFRTEAKYLAIKTAETWAKCYLILRELDSSGSAPTESELINQLPKLEWPV